MPAPIALAQNLKSISAALQSPELAIDLTEFKKTSEGLGERLPGDQLQIVPFDPDTLSSAHSAGSRLSAVLSEAQGLTDFLGDPGQAFSEEALGAAIAEIQSILSRARPLKRLAVLQELLGAESEISLEFNPAVERVVGQWGNVWHHSHHMTHCAVAGQALAECGSLSISKEPVSNDYVQNEPCYRVKVSTAYTPKRTVEYLVNANPDNAYSGQVAEWIGPLEYMIGIFFTDPRLGGMNHPKPKPLDLESLRPSLLQQPDLALEEPDWGQVQESQAADTKRSRDFGGQYAEDYADCTIKAILERRITE